MSTNVQITPRALKFNKISYFRANAESNFIGAIGEMRHPLGKSSFMEVKDQVPAPKLKKAQVAIVDIDYASTKKDDIAADVRPSQLKFAGGSISAMRSLVDRHQLRLMKVSVLNNDMEDAINQSPKVLDDLIAWGKDARVVLQVWVLLSGQLASQVKTGASASVDFTVNGVSVGLDAGRQAQSSTKLEFDAPCVFAYLPGSFDWDANAKKKRTRVVDIDMDQQGIG